MTLFPYAHAHRTLDQYGGSLESVWTRWILEQFEFPFTRIYAPELTPGNLNAQDDAIVFVGGAIPGVPAAGAAGDAVVVAGGCGPDPQTIPAEYRAQLGRVAPTARFRISRA